MSKVRITITGYTATGKSTIAAIISEALANYGFSNVDFQDVDPLLHTLKNLDAKTEAIKEVEVLIEVKQLNRGVETPSPYDISAHGGLKRLKRY
jgi:adenylylsulfate kinase-like enzyme